MVVKYGWEKFLMPFIEDANKLYDGISMLIDGREKTVRGGVLFLLADTLAAHSVGGFKVGVGFALRKCRSCLATKEQISSKFEEKYFSLRTRETYDYHCSLLDGPTSSEDSTTYGVNFYSPLNQLKGFHVVDNLPQDVMHVLFEGVLPYELTLMIRHFVSQEKLFSLDELNECVQSYLYSTLEGKDKPSLIHHKVLSTSTVAQSSAQMWNLAMNFPMIIGHRIPEDHKCWESFLLLLEIVKFSTVKVALPAHASILKTLIKEHSELFQQCYPNASMIPKLHYLVHFPRQIKQTGPIYITGCMRMEAKNSYCKSAAQSSNFKNIPYSVAKRHQRLLCAQLNSARFFDTQVECGPAKDPLRLEDEEQLIRDKLSNISEDTLVYRVKWICHLGIKYGIQEYVIIGYQEDDLPLFGKIEDIAVISLLLMRKLCCVFQCIELLGFTITSIAT